MAAAVTSLILSPLASQGSGAAVSERFPVASIREPVRAKASATRSEILAASRSETCRDARYGLRWYQARVRYWTYRMGAGHKRVIRPSGPTMGIARSCPRLRLLAKHARSSALRARRAYERWWHYHFAWWDWMPAKWQRIGACETGYGKRPGNFHWNSGQYQGFAGFAVSSWDAFRLPGYPSEAYLATPRQQLNVALAIWRRYGYSGWGCRNA